MRRLVLCAAVSLVLTPAAPALAQEAEWLEQHPLGEPVDPDEVEFLDNASQAGLPLPAPGKRYAEIDGMIVELDPESYELLQLIRRSAGVAEVPGPILKADADDQEDRGSRNEERGRGDEDEDDREEDQTQGIPAGHLPPPGSCRVWHPDRPAGHQPPPTSCDVEVPPGAFLVRG